MLIFDETDTVHQQFDKACDEVLTNLTVLPSDMLRMTGHPAQLASTIFHVNWDVSALIAICNHYADDQESRLLVRNSVNKEVVARFRDVVKPRIKEAVDLLSAENSADLHDRTNRFLGTQVYDECQNEIAQMILHKSTSLSQCFRKVTALLEQSVRRLATINSTVDHDRLLSLFITRKKEWMNIKENRTIIKSFRKDCKGMTQAQEYTERKNLRSEYSSNPIVQRIHSRFSSEPALLVEHIRKGDFSQEQLDEYFEYLHKLELLENHDTPSRQDTALQQDIGTPESEPLQNYIFNTRKVPDNNHLAQLRQWMQTTLPEAKNQTVIPYYVLSVFRLLSTYEVTQFIHQMADWFPQTIPATQERQYAKALYTELEKWKSQQSDLPPYPEFLTFLRQSSFSNSKQTLLRQKVQAAYVDLNTLLKSWNTQQ